MPIRDPIIQHIVRFGLLPEDIGQEFDDWSDELAHRVVRGELSQAEADTLTEKRASIDADRAKVRGYPIGEAATVLRRRRTKESS